MKTLLLLAGLLSVVAGARNYGAKYDNIDVDQVLRNNRLLDNYLKCILEVGRCTPEGQELKQIIPDAIKDACSNCNEKQKQSSEKVIRHLVKNRKKDWDKLLKKYDPEGKYRHQYEHLLN